MTESVALENREAYAFEEAVNEVADLLNDTKSLEMVEQNIYRMKREKELVETRLKEAVEAQLRGVRTGLFNLQKVLRETTEISESMETVNNEYDKLHSSLGDEMKDIVDTRKVHRQHDLLHRYLQNIYSFKEDIEVVKTKLNQDDLLGAHTIFMTLEDCREGICRNVLTDTVDEMKRQKVDQFFSGMGDLNQMFLERIRQLISEALSRLRSGTTTKLVSIIRIIEREENRDKACLADTAALQDPALLNRKYPARPKKWKSEAEIVIGKSVETHITEMWREAEKEKAVDAQWMTRFAGKLKRVLNADLRDISERLRQCFPPTWNVIQMFIRAYHKSIGKRFRSIIDMIGSANKMPSSSYIVVYNWSSEINTMLSSHGWEGHGVLTPDNVDGLVKAYNVKLKSELDSQSKKILQQEDEIRSTKSPERTNDDRAIFYTSTPVIFYEMLDQNIKLVVTLPNLSDLQMVLATVHDVIDEFRKTYLTGVQQYKIDYLAPVEEESPEDREKRREKYVEWLIASANNAIKCTKLNNDLINYLEKSKDKDISGLPILRILETKSELFEREFLDPICRLLSNEVFSVLQTLLPMLLTAEWRDKRHLASCLKTIIEYYQYDFALIEPPGDIMVMEVIAEDLLRQYLYQLFQTKSLSVTADEFGTMLMGEHDQITSAFRDKIPLPIKLPEYGCLKSIAEIVSDTKDLALVMDLAAFVKEYPDIRYDQCVAILALRGDMSRDEIRTELANSGVTEEHGGGGSRRTIFSDVADVTGPLASRFFQTVVAPGMRGATASTTSQISKLGSKFNNISLAASPVINALNNSLTQAKEEIMTPRKLDYSDQGGYGGERTNPFDEPTSTNPFGEEPSTREMKGRAPVPPGKGGRPGINPFDDPRPPALAKKKKAPPPPPGGAKNKAPTNPFDSD